MFIRDIRSLWKSFSVFGESANLLAARCEPETLSQQSESCNKKFL